MKVRRRLFKRQESKFEQERAFFEKKIEKYLMKISEVNWIASELKFQITLLPRMHSLNFSEDKEEVEEYDILKCKPKLYIRVSV